MPYTAAHKQQTRERIVECARVLFNRYGYDNVSIDKVMEDAELTRGGFYNHFKSKEELFAAAVSSFLMGRGAQWRAEAGVEPAGPPRKAARQMLAGYPVKEASARSRRAMPYDCASLRCGARQRGSAGSVSAIACRDGVVVRGEFAWPKIRRATQSLGASGPQRWRHGAGAHVAKFEASRGSARRGLQARFKGVRRVLGRPRFLDQGLELIARDEFDPRAPHADPTFIEPIRAACG